VHGKCGVHWKFGHDDLFEIYRMPVVVRNEL
jgi:hypothetical protein